MSGFDPAWLELRASADRSARDSGFLMAACSYANETNHALIVDLGCGAGATVQVMGPLLSTTTRWRLVDSDPALLCLAKAFWPPEQVEMDCRDLAAPKSLRLEGARLVTGSALFDLVSASWIDRVVLQLRKAGAALYAALSYDGHIRWSTAHPLDGQVLLAFNRHQRSDKGFGLALGPDATAYLACALERAGYQTCVAESPWRLGSAQAELVRAIIEEIARAVIDDGCLDIADIESWRHYRAEMAESGTCVVGHQDLLALPFQTSAAGRTQSGSKAQSKIYSPPRS